MRVHEWGFESKRPRSRLRNRNTIRGFRKYYYLVMGNNDAIYDKDKILESGYTAGQGWGCLDKAWNGFMRAKRLENYEDMKLYARIIQRVEKELKIEVNDFPGLGLCACDLEEDAREEEENDNYIEVSLDDL